MNDVRLSFWFSGSVMDHHDDVNELLNSMLILTSLPKEKNLGETSVQAQCLTDLCGTYAPGSHMPVSPNFQRVQRGTLNELTCLGPNEKLRAFTIIFSYDDDRNRMERCTQVN